MECVRRWREKNAFRRINVYSSDIGIKIWRNYQVNNVSFVPILSLKEKSNLFLSYLKRTILGCRKVLRIGNDIEEEHVVYSASDFWPDAVPAFFLHRKLEGSKWIAAFYLFAPNPLSKNTPYKGSGFIRGLLFYFTQVPMYWLIKKRADMVFVTSDPDVERFITKRRSRDEIVVIQGGVDTKFSRLYLTSGEVVPVDRRRYDACFVGRFHYQKGIMQLLDVWKMVCRRKPDARLALIGRGPLEGEMKRKIAEMGLANNVELLGFKDGKEKYEIFKDSKIVVHPAIYDSGGMAACEAMAWGLPGVGFDLPAFKTYYPQGMIKAPLGDLSGFADSVIKLLEDETIYEKTRDAAISWAEQWDWDKRAERILKDMKL